jgi:hypothetical protein
MRARAQKNEFVEAMQGFLEDTLGKGPPSPLGDAGRDGLYGQHTHAATKAALENAIANATSPEAKEAIGKVLAAIQTLDGAVGGRKVANNQLMALGPQIAEALGIDPKSPQAAQQAFQALGQIVQSGKPKAEEPAATASAPGAAAAPPAAGQQQAPRQPAQPPAAATAAPPREAGAPAVVVRPAAPGTSNMPFHHQATGPVNASVARPQNFSPRQ